MRIVIDLKLNAIEIKNVPNELNKNYTGKKSKTLNFKYLLKIR
jgi:hypothetical protein